MLVRCFDGVGFYVLWIWVFKALLFTYIYIYILLVPISNHLSFILLLLSKMPLSPYIHTYIQHYFKKMTQIRLVTTYFFLLQGREGIKAFASSYLFRLSYLNSLDSKGGGGELGGRKRERERGFCGCVEEEEREKWNGMG